MHVNPSQTADSETDNYMLTSLPEMLLKHMPKAPNCVHLTVDSAVHTPAFRLL